MKKTLKQLIAVIIAVVLFIGGLRAVTELTRVKVATTRDLSYKSFFDHTGEYDVLFFGTSHVMFGVNPLEIWKEYRIRSYNWGSPVCSPPSIYWKILNVLNYSTPELIVVDCYGSTWKDKTVNSYRVHEAFDAFPMSYTKYIAINDLMKNETRMDDGEVYSKREIYGQFFLLSDYHNRWASLNATDFRNDYIDTKGCEFDRNVDVPIEISNTKAKLDITDDMTGVVYLKKIIEECQNRHIPILLTYLPFPTGDDTKMESNMIEDIANEYGVNYINFTDLNVVNPDTDYADTYNHLNTAGQKKVSEYLGQYILDNYDIPNQLDPESSARWDKWYTQYQKYENSFLPDTESLSTYLMMLYRNSNTIIIDLNDNAILNDPVYYDLLSSIGNGVKAIGQNTDFIILIKGESTVLNDFRTNGIIQETESGTFSYISDESGYSLNLNGTPIFHASSDDRSYVMINVTDGEETIDTVKFVYTPSKDVESAERYTMP